MPDYNSGQFSKLPMTIQRSRVWYFILIVVFGIFFVRLFYLQVIRHDYYTKSADAGHLKEYEIPAARGAIKAHSGDTVVPIVLNQTLYTVYADPTLVKKSEEVAATLAVVLNGKASDFEAKLRTKDTRYVIIARKVSKEQKTAILKKKYPGVGAQEQPYRIYPDGVLASQILGFVNNDDKGVYGIEQALNPTLAGKPGKLKAVTDINGVPLAANTNNILEDPTAGSDVVLNVDVAMQKQLEDILKTGLDRAKATEGSALILDPNTGAVKAMANLPTYDPANFGAVTDGNVFSNAAVTSPLEIGSSMKPLTAAAALDQGVVRADTTYYDPASYKIDGYTVKNIEEDGGPGTKSISDILNLSLNTGATWLLMQMGGSNTEVNAKAREVWFKYMSDHYRFGKATGVEQGYEAEGLIPDPNKGYGRSLTYANTAFGQAMTATPLQLGAAFAAIVNGGKYYQPQLVDYTINPDGTKNDKKPKILQSDVVSQQVSNEIIPMLEHVVSTHSFSRKFDQNMYSVGGKTGTAQIAENGKYLENEYNGTYVGFVGGNKPDYVIVVCVRKPKIGGYAGSMAAQPIFGDLAHMLIDKFNVSSKS